MNNILEKLKGVKWSRYGVSYVVLFGSATRSEYFEDLDLAILFENEVDLDKIIALIDEISEKTGIPFDKIDVAILNNDIPCVLIQEALGKGILIYAKSREKALDDIIKRLKICWDFEISYKKLDLLNTALNAVKKKWVS